MILSGVYHQDLPAVTLVQGNSDLVTQRLSAFLIPSRYLGLNQANFAPTSGL